MSQGPQAGLVVETPWFPVGVQGTEGEEGAVSQFSSPAVPSRLQNVSQMS